MDGVVISFPEVGRTKLPTKGDIENVENSNTNWHQFFHLRITYQKAIALQWILPPGTFLDKTRLETIRQYLKNHNFKNHSLLQIDPNRIYDGIYTFLSLEASDSFENQYFPFRQIQGYSYEFSVAVGIFASVLGKTIPPFVTFTGMLDVTTYSSLSLVTQFTKKEDKQANEIKLLLCLGLVGYENFPDFYIEQSKHRIVGIQGNESERTKAGEVKFFFVPQGFLQSIKELGTDRRYQDDYEFVVSQQTPPFNSLSIIEVKDLEEALIILTIKETVEDSLKSLGPTKVTKVWTQKDGGKYQVIIEEKTKKEEKYQTIIIPSQISITITIHEQKFVFYQTQERLFFLQTPITNSQYYTIKQMNMPNFLYRNKPFIFLTEQNSLKLAMQWIEDFEKELKIQFSIPNLGGKIVRLPTPEEWQIACTPHERKHLGEFANIENRDILPVGNDTDYYLCVQRKSNIYGLFDLLGNIWQLAQKKDGSYIFIGGDFSSKREEFVYDIPQKQLIPQNTQISFGFRPVLALEKDGLEILQKLLSESSIT